MLVSREASENTKKKFRNMCDYYRVPLAVYGGKEERGGKHRSGVPRFSGVTDPGFDRGQSESNLKMRMSGGLEYG